MKFRLVSASLAVFLAVLGAASFTRCGSDGGIFTEIDSGLLAEYLADEALDMCGGTEGLNCNGDIEDGPSPLSKGPTPVYDLQALFDLVTMPIRSEGGWVTIYIILDTLEVEELLPDLGEDGRRLTVVGQDTVDCSDDDGTLTMTTTVNAFIYMDGENALVDFSERFDQVQAVSFNNCLVEGSILNDEGASESLRLNGTLTFIEHEPADVEVTGGTVADPYTQRLTGNVTITDRDSDTGTAGLQDFWATPFNAKSNYAYDGESLYNGGVCVGAGVNLGNESDDDGDDDCAEDTDEGDEGFLDSGYATFD